MTKANRNNLIYIVVPALVVSLTVFLINYIKAYRQISNQLNIDPLSTSFPPSSAWIVALPLALGVFVALLVVGYLAVLMWQRKHN